MEGTDGQIMTCSVFLFTQTAIDCGDEVVPLPDLVLILTLTLTQSLNHTIKQKHN